MNMENQRNHLFRMKKSAKPSSSGRSAEFLGSQKSLFPTQILKAGLSEDDKLMELTPNTKLNIVIRKLNKKDPITKKKALEELIRNVNHCDVEELVTILPLWSKIYKSLACDPTHNVRDLTQVAHKNLALKCNRKIAPYLKQLVPVWLFSQFDNYTPAANTARSSFYDIFNIKSNRIQEVCMHCQIEILQSVHDYLSKFLAIFVSKRVEDNDLLNKICESLEVLSFFTEHTKTKILFPNSYEIISSILALTNFWTLGTQGAKHVRAAWFKVIYNLVQNESIDGILLEYKKKIIEISFEGIVESDNTLASAIWKLILQLQFKYGDWFDYMDYENIELKLQFLFRNNFFNNFELICPKMLQFYSSLMSAYFNDLDCHTLLEKYLTDLSKMFCSDTLKTKENDYKAIFGAYFDGWKFLLNKIYNDDQSEQKRKYVLQLLHTTIIDPMELLISSNRPVIFKMYVNATMCMIADFNNSLSHDGQNYLLTEFWKSIFDFIKKMIYGTKHFPEEIIELVQQLVQLNHGIIEYPDNVLERTNEEMLNKIVLQLSLCCFNNIASNECQNCVKHIHSFIDLVPEPEFYKEITNSNDLNDSIKIFVDLIALLEKEFYLDVVEIIFKFLHFVNIDERLEFIKSNLLSIQPIEVQLLIVDRLLVSTILNCSQRELLLCGPEVRTIIRNIMKSGLQNESIDTSKWFERLFFQDENGVFIFGVATVDALLNEICESLQEDNYNQNELCWKVLSQAMPTLFTQKNILQETKTKMFSKLFLILMQATVNKCLSEEIFDKLTSCWGNVLSNENIMTEESILHNLSIVKHMLVEKKLEIPDLGKCAHLITQIIIGAAKNISPAKISSMKLNKIISSFLGLEDISPLIEKLYEYCSSLEAINGMVSVGKELNYNYLEHHEIIIILQRSLLNLFVIKLLNEPNNLYELKNNLSENEQKTVKCTLCDNLLDCMSLLSAGENVIKIQFQENLPLKAWVMELHEQIKCLKSIDCGILNIMEEKLIEKAMVLHTPYCRCLHLLVNLHKYQIFEENATIIFTEEVFAYFLEKEEFTTAVYFLQYQLPKVCHRAINVEKIFLCAKSSSVWIKCAALRCLVIHYFKGSEMEKDDRLIITQLIKLVREISEHLLKQDRKLYNVDINTCDFEIFLDVLEYIRLLTSILRYIPWSIGSKEWDDITTGMSAWVSSMLQSIEMFSNLTVTLFIINVCRIFTTFTEFIKAEEKSSSTKLITKAKYEYESLFANEVHYKMFQAVYTLLQIQEKEAVEFFPYLFNETQQAVKHLDFEIVYSRLKTSIYLTPEHVFMLLVGCFSNSSITVQKICAHMLHELTHHYVVEDIQNLKTMSNSLQLDGKIKHYVKLFEHVLMFYESFIGKYTSEFSFKLSEIDDFELVDNQKALGYLLMWDSIIHACVKSPLFVRSIYTSWLYERRFFEKFLHFIIRLMPTEVLKNHDTKFIACEIFNDLPWTHTNDENIALEKYACHLYIKVLKKLPAVVRKWWNVSTSRQKVFVDKLTTNFVSTLISDEELKSISENKERHENMQVTVHLSTREVLAVYFIDEVRTELTLTLPPNYPLGPVKVNCGKSIGGRLSSRNIAMQLALFLTHQNGTILDGLTLWKSSLDKKFEGIEECYVCYTIIHHDTCQLPKLTCKTCKKKFHGTCLYKWFTTSSKSTCPICRNVF